MNECNSMEVNNVYDLINNTLNWFILLTKAYIIRN